MNVEKVNQLLASPEFVTLLLKSDSADTAVEWLNKAGAECTAEEGMDVLMTLLDSAKSEVEAMDLDSMDAVAGGAAADAGAGEAPEMDTATMVYSMARKIVSSAMDSYVYAKGNRFSGLQTAINAAGGSLNMILDMKNHEVSAQTFTLMGVDPATAAQMAAQIKQ